MAGTSMTRGKVSVIIPAYNRDKYIRQTVDSVLNQTWPNIELIVVDDGSTDNTRRILEEYGERICLLEHPGRVNKGQSAAINAGLNAAAGDYICILDSDDYWEPEKVRVQVEYLEKHEDVGFVYCNVTAVDENGDFLYTLYSEDHVERNRPEDILLDCYILLPCSAMLRSEVFRKAGLFDESLRAAQDHDMTIRLYEQVRVAYIDRPLANYRRHPEAISQYGAERRWRNGFIILEKARKRHPYPLRVILKRKAVLHFRLFQCAMEMKNYFIVPYHLLLAGLYDPLRSAGVLLGRENISGLH